MKSNERREDDKFPKTMRRVCCAALVPAASRTTRRGFAAVQKLQPLDAVKQYLKAIANVDVQGAEALLDPDCIVTLMPSVISPGEVQQFKYDLLKSMESSKGMVVGRELVVRQLVELRPVKRPAGGVDEELLRVMCEYELRGQMQVDGQGGLGFKRGDTFRVATVAFFELRETTHQIVAYRSYESYFPFGQPFPALEPEAAPL